MFEVQPRLLVDFLLGPDSSEETTRFSDEGVRQHQEPLPVLYNLAQKRQQTAASTTTIRMEEQDHPFQG
jgi:hypothetical protein